MNTQTRRQGWRAARPGGDGNGDGMIARAPIRVGEDQPPLSWDPVPSPRGSLKSTGREIPDNLFNGSNFLKFLKIYCFRQHDGHYNSVLCCSPHSTHKPV
uniref:Uncharacterized protein n=1 Tax=Oryza nivara TaxID=4536 RepID=A0A0E0J9K0_ORYNI